MLSTKQKKKAANVVRVYLSDYDRISGTPQGNPQFAVNVEPFYDTFDNTKPVYCALESFVCSLAPTYAYGLVWVNMPVFGKQFAPTWSANRTPAFMNCLGIMSQYGTTSAPKLVSDTLGIALNMNQLMSSTTWEFNLFRNSGASVATDLGTYIFCLCFYQRPDDGEN